MPYFLLVAAKPPWAFSPNVLYKTHVSAGKLDVKVLMEWVESADFVVYERNAVPINYFHCCTHPSIADAFPRSHAAYALKSAGKMLQNSHSIKTFGLKKIVHMEIDVCYTRNPTGNTKKVRETQPITCQKIILIVPGGNSGPFFAQNVRFSPCCD